MLNQNFHLELKIPKSRHDFADQTHILSPYLGNMIKEAILISRLPLGIEGQKTYKRLNLWLDDLSRFIQITATLAKFLPSQENKNIKEMACKHHYQLLTILEDILLNLKEESRKSLTNILEGEMIPELIIWKKKVLPRLNTALAKSI